MSFVIGTETKFTGIGSVLANRADTKISGLEESLLLGQDTIFTRMGGVLGNRAGH